MASIKKVLFGLLTLVLSTGVDALSSPPSGAITVGTGGKYATLAKALADTSSSTYFIYSGSYTGQTVVSRSNIKIYGQTSVDADYTGNKVTLTANVKASTAGSNDASGTLQIHAAGVKVYNVNIANTYGTSSAHEQAVALSVAATQFGCYGCKITGYQDTLLVEGGYSIFSKSYIAGAVDFIFGRTGSTWITNSVINTVGTGYVTASGRQSADSNYFVINNSEITGTGTQYLGRPWGNYARVVVQGTNLHSNIQSAGWHIWNTGDERTDHVTFAEYKNSGDGASGTRASFSTKLSSAVSISTVLGSGYTSWVDTAYPIG